MNKKTSTLLVKMLKVLLMSSVVYYEHGQVVRISPEPNTSYYEVRGIINEATSIFSDGIYYDLTDRHSIYSIAVPKYTYTHGNLHAQDLGVTGYLDYVLRMHAGLLWTGGNYKLAMACLEKACQLMLYSTIGWQRRDFYRVVKWYIELGRFKKAQDWKEWIDSNTTDPADYAKAAFEETVASCKYLDTDFVEVGDFDACCETCAKYRKRIYSLSGKSRKFPAFPSDFHFQCGLPTSPFVLGVSEPSFRCIGYALYSNRPFRDDRSKVEKENYTARMERLKKEQHDIHEADLNHIIYHWFKPIFPNDFPKSLGGFSRMRNSNSKNYQKLIEKVQSAGYRIPSSLEEVAEWDIENN